jgi:ABC-type bacteriocin/lantibiotic exporter with double-glycine peptidase domain
VRGTALLLSCVRMPSSIWRPALALALTLGSCKSAPAEPVFLSDSAVLLDLPLVRQDELYNCGLAAISALCQYWDVTVPPEQRAVLAKLARDEKGLSGDELRQALEADGLEVFLFSGTLDRTETGVYRHIDAGRPLLVMLSPDGKGHHYCLVLGYDEPRRSLVLLDPARGEVVRSVQVFERGWEDCQRFTLLATPKKVDDRLPSGGGAK